MWEDLSTHSGAKTTSHPTLFDEDYLTHGVKEDEHFLAHSVSTIAEESGSSLAFSVLCLHLLCVLISCVYTFTHTKLWIESGIIDKRIKLYTEL